LLLTATDVVSAIDEAVEYLNFGVEVLAEKYTGTALPL
jgi:hypothetical protein